MSSRFARRRKRFICGRTGTTGNSRMAVMLSHSFDGAGILRDLAQLERTSHAGSGYAFEAARGERCGH